MTALADRVRAWAAASSFRSTGPLESAVMRLLFACVVWKSLVNYDVRYTELSMPVGMARWTWLWDRLGWDLTRLCDPTVWNGCLWAAGIALLFYVAGVGLPLALPVVAFVQIGIRTVNNSQGAPHHGIQMVSLVLLAQWLVVWVMAVRKIAARVRRRPPPTWATRERWTWIWLYSVAAAAITYVVSVCTKLDESDGRWLQNSHYVAGQIVKTVRQNYYNALDPKFTEGEPPVVRPGSDPAHERYRHPIPHQAAWLQRHDDTARLIFGIGFVLEMAACLAVLGRWWALVTGMALVSLHSSIEWLMGLTFPLNEWVVAVFFINAGGWLCLMVRDPACRPSWRLWLAALALEGILLVPYAAVPESARLTREFFAVLQAPGEAHWQIVSGWPSREAFAWWRRLTAPLHWPVVIAVQTLCLAVVLNGLSVAIRRIRLTRQAGKARVVLPPG